MDGRVKHITSHDPGTGCYPSNNGEDGNIGAFGIFNSDGSNYPGNCVDSESVVPSAESVAMKDALTELGHLGRSNERTSASQGTSGLGGVQASLCANLLKKQSNPRWSVTDNCCRRGQGQPPSFGQAKPETASPSSVSVRCGKNKRGVEKNIHSAESSRNTPGWIPTGYGTVTTVHRAEQQDPDSNDGTRKSGNTQAKEIMDRIQRRRSEMEELRKKLKGIQEDSENEVVDASNPSKESKTPAEFARRSPKKKGGEKQLEDMHQAKSIRVYPLDQNDETSNNAPLVYSPMPVNIPAGEPAEYLSPFTSAIGGDVTLDARHTTKVQVFAGVQATTMHLCKALLDTGSPASFIQQRCVDHMLECGSA